MVTVLLHGSGPDHGEASWPVDAPTLDERVVVLTRPGFGTEPTLPPGSDEVAWLAAMLAGHDDVHLVAHSFGGALALALCTMRPDLAVGGLTLVEPPPTSAVRDRGSAAVRKHVDRIEAAYASAHDLAMFATSFMQVFHPSWTPNPQTFGPEEQRHFARLAAQPAPWDLNVDEAAVLATRPVTVVTGSWDPVFTEVGAHLGDRGATWVELQGCGHAPQHADGFLDLVRRHRGRGPR